MLPEPLVRIAKEAYASPGRAYHDYSHIEELFVHFEAAKSSLERPREVALAILFHDAIYVPGMTDNEAKSAELARKAIAEHMPDADVARVSKWIELTAKHGKLTPGDVDHDGALFLDMDMAILATDAKRFGAYDRAIQKEYSAIPAEMYAKGRRAFLKKLVRNERIYLSQYGHERWEAKARANLARALETRFWIVNVFALPSEPLTGNPLCVIENALALTDTEMQAIARQMNLSETTFLLPAKRVRIFTPTFELPFAGHPTLGSAHVVRALGGTDRVTLEMGVGAVDVVATGDRWTLRAAQPPITRSPPSRETLAAMLGLSPSDIGDAMWVDTGAEQLIVPLSSPGAVTRARPDAALLSRDAFSKKRGAAMAYVWAKTEDGIVARFFFVVHGAAIEDPATGSACANLGGYMLATNEPLPFETVVSQGSSVGRPSRLGLRVDRDRSIYVSGEVIAIARGAMTI